MGGFPDIDPHSVKFEASASTVARMGLSPIWVRRLVERVESSDRPLVLLGGIAGCGKSTLLEVLSERYGVPVQRGDQAFLPGTDLSGSGLVLFDCGAKRPQQLAVWDPAQFRSSGVRTVVACRTAQGMAEIDRLTVYGCAETITSGEFFLTPQDASQYGPGSASAHVRSGGWPCGSRSPSGS